MPLPRRIQEQLDLGSLGVTATNLTLLRNGSAAGTELEGDRIKLVSVSGYRSEISDVALQTTHMEISEQCGTMTIECSEAVGIRYNDTKCWGDSVSWQLTAGEANHRKFLERREIVVSGNARIESDEFRAKADRIKIAFPQILFEGNVELKIAKEAGESRLITARRVEFDPTSPHDDHRP